MGNRRYQVYLADAEEARKIHYSVRYKVFCEDRGFEDAAAFPDRQERDSFDRRSAHFIVRDSRSGEWVGAARLILPGGGPLQVEARCGVGVCSQHASGAVAEVSRLAIVRGQEGRPACGTAIGRPLMAHQANTAASKLAAGREPGVLLQMLHGITEFGHERGIGHAAFFVTRALARMLAGMGIKLIRIGDPIEHRGTRTPYLLNVAQVYPVLQAIVATPAASYASYSGSFRRGFRASTAPTTAGRPHGHKRFDHPVTMAAGHSRAAASLRYAAA